MTRSLLLVLCTGAVACAQGGASAPGTSRPAAAAAPPATMHYDAGSRPPLSDDGGTTPAADVPVDACDAVEAGAAVDPCCAAVAGTYEHTLLDAFVAAYPITAVPSLHDDIDAFAPVAAGHPLEARVSSGDEYVDRNTGGVTVENLRAGREVVRAEVMAALGPTDEVLSTVEPEPEYGGGDAHCTRWGTAWGSVIYRTTAGALNERVYLYLGICNDGDIEGFYRSHDARETCPDGTMR